MRKKRLYVCPLNVDKFYYDIDGPVNTVTADEARREFVIYWQPKGYQMVDWLRIIYVNIDTAEVLYFYAAGIDNFEKAFQLWKDTVYKTLDCEFIGFRLLLRPPSA